MFWVFFFANSWPFDFLSHIYALTGGALEKGKQFVLWAKHSCMKLSLIFCFPFFLRNKYKLLQMSKAIYFSISSQSILKLAPWGSSLPKQIPRAEFLASVLCSSGLHWDGKKDLLGSTHHEHSIATPLAQTSIASSQKIPVPYSALLHVQLVLRQEWVGRRIGIYAILTVQKEPAACLKLAPGHFLELLGWREYANSVTRANKMFAWRQM